MRYVFTVTAGRSGQHSLTELLSRHVAGVNAVCEAPRPKLRLARYSGFLGSLETKFRRRFFETNELLGRGKVLRAFEAGDAAYLDGIARRRLAAIHKSGAEIYVDVSKFFARGLHRAFARAVEEFSLILLVRDPLLNMKSFLNRNKNFTLDNSLPDAKSNELVLNSADFAKGELYLWAWCEMILRYEKLIREFGVKRHVVIRTEELERPDIMGRHLDALDLPHSPCERVGKINVNPKESSVDKSDVALFENFVARLSEETLRKLNYLQGYDPRRVHGLIA